MDLHRVLLLLLRYFDTNSGDWRLPLMCALQLLPNHSELAATAGCCLGRCTLLQEIFSIYNGKNQLWLHDGLRYVCLIARRDRRHGAIGHLQLRTAIPCQLPAVRV